MVTGPQGEVRQRNDGTELVVLHRTFPDRVEDVWAALTESHRLARWIGSFTGEGGTGGTVEFTVTGEVDAGGEVAEPVTVSILDCSPPTRLVVDFPADGGGSWHIAVTLAEHAGGTTLEFTQRLAAGVDATDVEAGWRWYLDRLAASVAGTPMPNWDDYAPKPADNPGAP
ncbi:SRPBCC domain-containing protein [Cryptosporangium minutisporangium]|uniref:Activator of Hsp90 ATPase homologue 1/2-like C-terminal domain-containing protein n=1 Tax=Cryptosporangium minutisporangium TaxID=113569 RepID=A0ABP6T3M6_9ACTN